jgi:hypothetical protein
MRRWRRATHLDELAGEPVRGTRRAPVAVDDVNVMAASCCVRFYPPAWYLASVTLFLVGSVLFLVHALASALVEHGPSS